MKLRGLICFIISLCGCNNTFAEEIHAAVASNFASPMKEIVSEFQHVSGHSVQLSFGSSGKLFAQIMHGAPYHVFFSADQEKAARLIEQKAAVAESRFTYATGRLALWSATPTSNNNEEVLTKLKYGRFNRLAIANPKFAPYGRAAMEVLNNLELTDTPEKKIIRGENIAQTYQFVYSGNAQLGFIALSQTIDNQNLNPESVWVVPETLHQPIKQDAVVLNSGKNSSAAKSFLDFIKSEKARTIIAAYGYETIKPKALFPNQPEKETP